MSRVAMIPARMGSKRVKNKNLRMINGKPLISHIVEAGIEADVFDAIYINSEADVFREIADGHGVKFYKRPSALASDEATNDDFALDFMNSVSCTILIQLLATSPFIGASEISDFVKQMADGRYETFIAVKSVQIEALFDGNPINFDQRKQTPPSQLLKPVQAYACGLMGWNCDRFKSNMRKYGAAYHGGDGSIGVFELSGFAAVDVDTEQDFAVAEGISRALVSPSPPPEYYRETDKRIRDADRERILTADGVTLNVMDEYNKEVVSISDLIEKYGRESSWSYTVINSPSNSATLIAQMPGEGNRMHFHSAWDEWWYIIDGEWEWTIEDEAKVVKEGDVVFIERGRKHKITAVGDGMSIRLAVSRNDVDHVYDPEDYAREQPRRGMGLGMWV